MDKPLYLDPVSCTLSTNIPSDDGFTSFIGFIINGAENPTHTRVSHDDSVLGNRREHFPFRLYDMLKYAAADDDLHSIVSWSADGLSFSIHQKDIFIERIVPKYFKITKFRSFVSTITIISCLLLNYSVNLY